MARPGLKPGLSRNLLKDKTWLHLLFLTLLYFFLRLYNLENNVNYSDEQGQFLLETFKIWRNKNLTLIGPPTSFSFQGRRFFQGPAIYYLLLPVMILGRWQPLAGSYLIIALNLVGLWLIYFSARKLFGELAGLIAAFGFAVFPETVYYTKFVWNPNFLPAISSVLLALLVGLGSFKPFLRIFLIGFFLGFGLQFHFQMVPLIIIILIFLLLRNKKRRLNTLFLALLGLGLGYFPIVLFEVRNNFYNLKTIWFVLKGGGFWQNGGFPSYYFLAWFPFLFVLGSGLLVQLSKKQKVLAGLIFLGLTLYWSLISYHELSGNRGMTKDWRYPYVRKAVQIIQNENLSDYNVASLVTGDTRAHALRYLLTIADHEPLGVKQYPQTRRLFVVSESNPEKIKKSSVWEISSFGGEIVRNWFLDEEKKFSLYRLDK